MTRSSARSSPTSNESASAPDMFSLTRQERTILVILAALLLLGLAGMIWL
jgi:hypothetical protein